MTEFAVGIPVQHVVEYLAENISPRKYWLHNKIGGVGWSVSRGRLGLGGQTIVAIDSKEHYPLISHLVLSYQKY